MSLAQDSACLGKHPHRSRADAQKQTRGNKGMLPYRCSFCGFWHVGHKLPASKRERYRKVAKELKLKDPAYGFKVLTDN